MGWVGWGGGGDVAFVVRETSTFLIPFSLFIVTVTVTVRVEI